MFKRITEGTALQIALFATGCAGIVAEFVLSTLATYLIGNAIFQWTMVMSLMLFAMGLGSRLSRFILTDLFDAFICVEYLLSLSCAVSAILAYGVSAYVQPISLVIYTESILIGLLIGLEIPLVARLNDAYDALRVNISNVMEKDYYGALLGGLIFAFVALPFFGLTYTPILLGSVNFFVAAFLFVRFRHLFRWKKRLAVMGGCVAAILIMLGVGAEPILKYGEQLQYKDKVIFAQQTAYQKIVMTQWKQNYWLYINGQEQFSSVDEERYHEPLVHPALSLSPGRESVLILGGGDGLAVREVLKYPDVGAITLVDLDPEMPALARSHPVLRALNCRALSDARVHVVTGDARAFIEASDRLYNVVIADLPDPDTVDLMHVYSIGFYTEIRKHLVPDGVLVTQATSPYFSKRAYLCIYKTMAAAGFQVAGYRNHIPTMGEWGWVLGVPETGGRRLQLRARLLDLTFDGIPTRWLSRDAMISMLHFGKGLMEPAVLADTEVNREQDPILYRYYREGDWGVY
ncbi:MAG: spermidine synthase [Deltaproteobacteria bacterium]|nr:MAG: spermidine synthase [Deltaproteobacteria bacterium]